MAPKKIRTSPAAEFVKSSADIIKNLLESMYAPIARLASQPAYDAAMERVTELLSIPTTRFTPDDFRETLVAVGNTLKASTESKEYITRFKKDRNGYTFTLNRKASLGGEVELGTLIETFPGSKIRGFGPNLSANDKASIIYAMMAAAGFNFTPQGDKFEAFYSPTVILNDASSKRKASEMEEITVPGVDTSGISGLIDRIEKSANWLHRQPMQNAAYQCAMRYEVEISSFGQDITVAIRPYVDISISEMLIPYMAETNDKSAVDYLVYEWMRDAIERATSRGRSSTKNLPAVDLRITSNQLKSVANKFNVAKPRLNEYGFCINRAGLPMFVPAIDSTAAFMQAHSNFSVGEDGYLNYEDVAHEWSNKIVLVDWFNDVIVYTQVNGKMAVDRLLGYVPLDKASEYVFLNTSLNNRFVQNTIKNLVTVVDSVVGASDAMNYLDPEYKTATSFNAGRISKNFAGLMGDLRSNNAMAGGKVDPSDAEFQYDDSLYSPMLKHLFGLDLDELPLNARGVCAHVAAYLRAASRERKNITMAIRDRLVGLEYFLIMSPKITQEKWGEVRVAAKRQFDKRKNAPALLGEIDIPNLDAGANGNLKGFMPHQVKVISDLARDADSGLVGVAAGGGKTLLQLVDVILKLQSNPSWRPLIATKPRLVKNFISEVNFFSKGKINIVSLRMSQLRYIARTLRLTTADALIKWVRAFPPNTIFICSYTDFASSSEIFTDLDVPSRVMLEDVGLPQFMHLLRIIGFEIVRLDESHSIKNMASKRSRFAFAALAQAQTKQLLSGTIINNTAVDLIGQAYGINPMAFGNDVDEFKDLYNLPGGLIKRDEDSQRINRRLRKFTQMSSATKEDWAFVLPDLFDQQIAWPMTPKQSQFYAQLMDEALIDLKAKLDKDDATGEDGDEDDEEDSDAAFQMKADASLAKVEQFLVSPDTNQQYLAWKERPTGDDLVSPMVKAIDQELARIYADRGADHANNKTAVFGINKVASIHFMKHSKFRDLCLHYRAGDEEIMRQFKSNPDKYILAADSTSLREGENMQMLSFIFDMQATWTPGDYEQLISRMYRPDPKGQYNKDSVTHFWVTPTHRNNEPSLSSVKLARMISKAISMARFRYENDPRWSEVSYMFDGLDLLSMNLDTIFNSTHNSLAPYFNAWSRFIKWEREINQGTRKRIAQELEQENPGIRVIDSQGNVLDRNLFTKLVMREAKSSTMLPNSKRVFTPWERGALPADIHDMSLTVLGSDEVERGQYVMTEYGPGIVHAWTDNQVIVELHGRKKAKIDRSRIAIPNGEGVVKLNAIISNPSAWQAETYLQIIQPFTGDFDPDASLAPRGSRRNISVKPAPVDAPAINPNAPTPKITIEAVKKKKVEEERIGIDNEDIQVMLINGMPAISLVDAPSGVENFGWLEVAPFYRITFDSWATADKFLVSMAKKFAIQKSKLDILEAEMDEFRTGKTMKLQKRVTNAQARNFFMETHRKLTTATDGRDRVNPYWIALNGTIYLAFSTLSHNNRVFQWLKNMATKNPGKIKAPTLVEERHINVFNTLAEAATDLRELAKNFDIDEATLRQELRELKEDIERLRGVKSRPITRR